MLSSASYVHCCHWKPCFFRALLSRLFLFGSTTRRVSCTPISFTRISFVSCDSNICLNLFLFSNIFLFGRNFRDCHMELGEHASSDLQIWTQCKRCPLLTKTLNCPIESGKTSLRICKSGLDFEVWMAAFRPVFNRRDRRRYHREVTPDIFMIEGYSEIPPRNDRWKSRNENGRAGDEQSSSGDEWD